MKIACLEVVDRHLGTCTVMPDDLAVIGKKVKIIDADVWLKNEILVVTSVSECSKNAQAYYSFVEVE